VFPVSLRELKRERTRQAIVDAAIDLFSRHGYEGTTVADIAAAAEIGTRTFFSYFASKEEVLFPESDARLDATVAAIANRSPSEGPADVLVRALREAAAADDDLTGPMAQLRLRLMQETPAVMGRGLQIQLAGQRRIARHLAEAFPETLDAVSAGALAGALTGAVTGALMAIFEDSSSPSSPPPPSSSSSSSPSPSSSFPSSISSVDAAAALARAAEIALAPWAASA
jgi:AcrR family transcriptional regulator